MLKARHLAVAAFAALATSSANAATMYLVDPSSSLMKIIPIDTVTLVQGTPVSVNFLDSQIAYSGGFLYATQLQTVFKIDPVSGATSSVVTEPWVIGPVASDPHGTIYVGEQFRSPPNNLPGGIIAVPGGSLIPVTSSPQDILFGKSGVWVADSGGIVRSGGSNTMAAFISTPKNAFSGDLAWGDDGSLLVSLGDRIDRFDPASGNLLNVFALASDLGTSALYEISTGPDGLLYVEGNGTMYRLNGLTGAVVDSFHIPSGNNGHYFAFNALPNPTGPIAAPEPASLALLAPVFLLLRRRRT